MDKENVVHEKFLNQELVFIHFKKLILLRHLKDSWGEGKNRRIQKIKSPHPQRNRNGSHDIGTQTPKNEVHEHF